MFPVKTRFICQAVLEENNFRNHPARSNNSLLLSCLLTDREQMSNLHRELSIDAFYHVSVHMAKRFQRRMFKCEKLTNDGRQVIAKAHMVFGQMS